MSLSSYCRNCGQSHEVSDYACNHCSKCETVGQEARQAAAAENPGLTEDQLTYVARDARQQRAHHPRQTYINPRDFDRNAPRS